MLLGGSRQVRLIHSTSIFHYALRGIRRQINKKALTTVVGQTRTAKPAEISLSAIIKCIYKKAT